MFGKRTAAFLLAGSVMAATILSGCSGPYSEAMEEYKELGISQMEAGDYADAAESFQNALDQSVGTVGVNEIDISYYKALALYMAGDADSSLETYSALIEFDPDNWETYYLRGTVLLQEGRDDEALKDYADAVNLNGNSSELCLNICYNLVSCGLQESAQPYMDAAFETEPETGDEFYSLGTICYLTGDYDNAQSYLEHALDLGNYEALGWLGEMALSKGDYEGAITYLTRALDAADEARLGTVVADLVAAYEYSDDFESAYDTAAAYLKDHQDEEIEKEYEFLATRLGILPEVMEADTADPVGEEASYEEDWAVSSDEADEADINTLDDLPEE